MDVWDYNKMQKCGTTKGVLYKELSKQLSSSHTLPILPFTDEIQVHSHAPTYSTTYWQTIAMTWNLQQGGSILSSKEVWIQHGPPSNFLLTEVPTRPLYLKLTYLGKKLSQVSFTIGETVVNLEICPEEISTDLKYTMSKHSKVVTNDQKS